MQYKLNTAGSKSFFSRIGDVGIYFGSATLAKAVPFFALPVITHYLSPTGYGSWSLYVALLSFITPFVGLMMRHQIARSFHTMAKYELASLVSTVFQVTCLSAILLLIVLALLGIFVNAQSFGIPIEAILMLPAIALLTSVQETATLIFRYESKPLRFAAFELGDALLFYLVAVTMLVAIAVNWEALVAARTLTASVLAIAGLFAIHRSGLMSATFDPAQMKTALAISLPLIPHALASTVIAMSDRIILQHMTSIETVGIYSVGYFIGSAVLLFAAAFSKTWNPWVHSTLANDTSGQARLAIVRWIYVYVTVLVVAGFAAWVGAQLYTIYLLDASYHGTTTIIPWIIGATVFQGLYFALFPILTYLGKTGIFAVATSVAAIVNVLATILLVRVFGMVGAAQATLLAYLVMFLIVLVATQSYFPLPWLLASDTRRKKIAGRDT